MTSADKATYLATATHDPGSTADDVTVAYVDPTGTTTELLTEPVVRRSPHQVDVDALTSLLAARGWSLAEPWTPVEGGLRATVTWSGEQLMDVHVRAAMSDELTQLLARATAVARSLTGDESLMDSVNSPHVLDLL